MSELSTTNHKLPALSLAKIPPALGAIINVEAWVSAILRKTPYKEPNPDFISTMIAFETISAQSVEEAFAQARIGKMQEMIPNTPGATTGPIEITDLYVASSDFETGNPCFVIITATDLTTGEEWKRTTGATNVQATIIALMVNGMWPIRCQIKRGDTKDKGDRYLMFVLPPD
jgi:hypothetical protein